MKVAIIGAGPAGIATAIQLKRYNIEPLLFEEKELGGLVKNASKIENLPGFPNGISGLELIQLFKRHLETYNIKVIFEKVILIDYLKSNFLIKTLQSEYYSDILVVASGTKPKELEIIKLLPQHLKKYVYYEIFPILKAENKYIMIIGAGDAAFDYALNLSKKNQILILCRGNKIKALPILRNRVISNPKITFWENSFIKKVEQGRKRTLLITFLKEGKINQMEIDYLIIAIGRLPQKDFYSPTLLKMEKKLLHEGLLYLVGDVKNDIYRQVAIASGDGVYTAMKIYWSKYENHWKNR